MADHVYSAIPLKTEMTDQGYWRVTWSVRPGLCLPVTCCKVGISRSEALEATAVTLAALGYRLEANE